MASYLIGYDLNETGKDYTGLIEAIKKVGTNWWHCLDSTWIVKHAGPSVAIRDVLSPYIDNNDELLVVKLTGEGAWVGFDNECASWLKSNL